MSEAALREEMKELIDMMPEDNLVRLRPLFEVLVDDEDDDTLSPKEVQLLEQCRRDRIERPETFISLDDFLRKYAASAVIGDMVREKIADQA